MRGSAAIYKDPHDKKKIQLKHKTIFNGIYNEEDFFKCFAPELDKDAIENVREIEFYYRKDGIIEDLQSSREDPYEVFISIHYPGQFLLDISKKERATLQLNNNQSKMVKISSIELLKRRKKRSNDCMENWRRFDEGINLSKHPSIAPSLIYSFRCFDNRPFMQTSLVLY